MRRSKLLAERAAHPISGLNCIGQALEGTGVVPLVVKRDVNLELAVRAEADVFLTGRTSFVALALGVLVNLCGDSIEGFRVLAANRYWFLAIDVRGLQRPAQLP